MKNTKRDTIKVAGRDTKIAAVTAEWLTARMRNGRRRVEVLGWKRLAAIYYANRPGSAIRNVINAEARRCGYTPSTILALNAD
ncbi:MAG: hypothetical protein ACE15C_20830 [Phycisphaerae bacterium]